MRYGWGAGEGADYGNLIRRLIEVNMVELDLFPAKVINSMLGVPKPSVSNPHRQRLITDARPCNAVFEMPWRVQLPNPSLFANLRIPSGSKVWFFQCDIDSMFHCFAVPDWLADLQGLPPLRARELGLSELWIWDVGWSAIGSKGRLLPLAHLSANGGPISHDDALDCGFVGEFRFGLTAGQSDQTLEFWANQLDRRHYRQSAYWEKSFIPNSFRSRGEELILHPRIRTMLMGWTGGVHCAQGILEHLVAHVTPTQAGYPILHSDAPLLARTGGGRPGWLRG